MGSTAAAVQPNALWIIPNQSQPNPTHVCEEMGHPVLSIGCSLLGAAELDDLIDDL